ncbi:PBP1A family penicillin-binding protein [Roseicyclus sp. F158]|uniref:Penicillin-binding protein 1A n=1 Tax=Tropicimonas omnivorans TaxID=3075590 RepID=A0ABU3DGR2_9RHOB|nr:PBP1A family penicillin-binding protein [Roseicyclus sp. F158]MDT0682893.1 PBP1A family penicillin-binding protein [Roseicyclus sp. F158]
MLRALTSLFGGLFTLLTTGALFAALLIGGIFWMYGRELPDHDDLATYAPKTISRIYSTEGRIIDEFAVERRLFVPASDIPDLVKQAFISAEDKNFYSHRGYDPLGMVAAAVDAAQGGRLRGASTITQQVMKNFLLSGDRSVERKIKELILASRVEEALPKDKILELYLNEIYLGVNSYGVAAAAQSYFNKDLDELSPGEAAYLAALPKAPSNLHPVRDYDAAIARRNFVLREMLENGYISDAAYEAAKGAPLQTVQSDDLEGYRTELPPRTYFTDEIRRQLSGTFGEEEFFGGGLTIRATVDPELQIEAAAALREALEDYDRALGRWRGSGKTIEADRLGSEDAWRAALAEVDIARDIDLENEWHPAVVLALSDAGNARLGIEGVEETEEGNWVTSDDMGWISRASRPSEILEVGDVVHVRKMTSDDDGSFIRWTLRQVPEVEGGFMAMDVHNGRVIAMQGGFSYQHSVFNRATQATRQPGSAFKPFVYAAALDSGYTPATIVVDAPIEVDTAQGVWRPKNSSNKFYGPTPLRTGIEQSRNLMTVRLAQEVGMDTVARYAEEFGVYDDMSPFLANALGSEETTIFKMVAAYSMFANGGQRVEPTLVDRVQDRWGKTVYRHDQRSCADCTLASLPSGEAPRIVADNERVIDAITAYQLTSMLQGVVQRGTAAGIVTLPVPVAGKTGTTNDAKDVWFVGFTSNIAAGCYIGYDRPRSLGRAYGGTTCGPVFDRFMKKATAKYGGGKFKVPPGGHFVKIDRFSGARLPDSASGPNVVAEYFRDGADPLMGFGGAVVDGGFAMGSNLPMFSRGETDRGSGEVVTTSTGRQVKIAPKASFGSMSSGGLY